MGVCQSAEAKSQSSANKIINRQLLKDQLAEVKTIKLLLLGPGECGKSTVLKQMLIIHRGMKEAEVITYKPIIYTNVLNAIYAICKGSDVFNIEFEDSQLTKVAPELRSKIDNFKVSLPFDPETHALIKGIWSDPATAAIFAKRHELQMEDSAKYFLDNLDRISQANYVPTQEDVLRARAATSGIVEVEFTFSNVLFSALIVFDVGGQKSERRKWIHAFDNVTAVIFIVAISEYDQNLREDPSTNRMVDSLALFRSVVNLPWFKGADFTLFLNKTDLFEQKIKKTPLSIAFPNFQGEATLDAATRFIGEQFTKCNETEKSIKCHNTCATDTKQVEKIINDVVVSLSQRNMNAFQQM